MEYFIIGCLLIGVYTIGLICLPFTLTGRFIQWVRTRKIESGGYATGGSYAFYRRKGHGPLGALYMVHSTLILSIELLIFALMLGYIWGSILTRQL